MRRTFESVPEHVSQVPEHVLQVYKPTPAQRPSIIQKREAAEVLWDLAGLGYRELVANKKVNVVSLPGQTVKVGNTFDKKFFLSALNDVDLELKHLEVSKNLVNSSYRLIPQVMNMQDSTEDRMKAVERQMNSLRQSLDVPRDHGVRTTVPQASGEKVCFGCRKPKHFVSQCPQRTANYTEIPMKGKIELWMKVGGFSKLASVLISDHLSEIIPGLDWLVNNKVSWKFDKARVTVGNKNRVVNKAIEMGVYVARTLLPMKYDGQCVRVLNLNDELNLIKQETRLADLSGATEANLGESYPEFVKQMHNRSLMAHQLARERLKTGALYRKSLYDAKVKVLTLWPGDKIWYLYPRFWQGRSPKWISSYEGLYLVDHLIPLVNAAIKKRQS
ncbi:hypothetical protein HELRODRAFT_175883 [Helobdella robusta]|uniref:CCHC-type domain-containing protein n=1 Tax=Helobdella robusta TaxID=6412 RepID=T1F9T9_HELRO|nr:hypothetical protein HELRODRAFT_175883 [Helobdella robusta]ESO00450.1 hypothetical protein HELRODRAFT_175883 [Helobdella robusta]